MKTLFAGLLREIRDFYTSRLQGDPKYDGGYEFLYNPEEACRKETKILLLTINPQAGGTRMMVETPCPERHALWSGEYKIRPQLLRLFQELRKNLAPSGGDDEEAFASTRVIASSAVPFRTHSAGDISPDMWMFSRYLWGRVFAEWEPRLILTVGYEAYRFAGAFFGFRYRALPEQPPDAGKAIAPRWMRFAKNGTTPVTLAGFPHFSRFPVFSADPDSPARAFVREVCDSARV
jgi:hypothetical protein